MAPSISGEAMGPSGARHLPIHGQSRPFISIDIIQANIIECNIMSLSIDFIISPAINGQEVMLVPIFEKTGLML